MSDKPKQRDILGDILNDPHTETIRGIDELTKLIHALPNDTAVKGGIKSQTPKKKKRQNKKRKTTHYLTNEVFNNLGEAREDIRDFLPDAAKSRATKSRIVESAITVVLQEFEKKGKESSLFRELLKKKDE